MFASPTAMWLDSFFAGYDHLFLKLMHGLEHTLGFVLTPLMKLVTLLGEKGLIFFLLRRADHEHPPQGQRRKTAAL